MSKKAPLRRLLAEEDQKFRIEGDTRDRIGRCAIRVSEKGKRGIVNADGKIDRIFLSPDAQSDVAKDFFTAMNIPYQEEESKNNADINKRASKEGSWQTRTGLQKHLEDARAGLFTDVAFYKLSRMARNAIDGMQIIDEFKKLKINVHFLRDNLGDINTPAGEIALGIFLKFAEGESANIGQFVSDAIMEKWKLGIPHGKPHGWLKKSNGIYEIDEIGWQTYRRIIELGLQDMSYVEISRAMNTEGFKTTHGKTWEHTQIMHILALDNIDKLQGHAMSMPMNLEGDTTFIRDAWPALIDENEAANLRIMAKRRSDSLTKRKSNNGGNTGSGVYARHMLSGVIKCAVCGEFLRAGQNKLSDADKTLYPCYLCQEGREGNPAHSAQKKISVSVANLDEAVLRVVVLDREMPPENLGARYDGPRRPKRRTVAQVEQDTLKLFAMQNEIAEWQFRLQLKNLNDEREKIVSDEEDEKYGSIALQQAIDTAKTEAQAKRLMVGALVAEATYPHAVQGKRTLYKAVKVVLKSGDSYLAPVYRATYQGDRVVIPLEDAE